MMQSLQRIIWLASYPKSGNTWTRMLLANYFMSADRPPDLDTLHRFASSDVRQDLYDLLAGGRFEARNFDHWVEVRPKVVRMIAASKPGHHFVKTHCQARRLGPHDLIPPDCTAAAVYVMRNPFDVAVSYSRHMCETVDETISRMADPKRASGTNTYVFEFSGRWDDHIASWLGAPGLPLHVMRYEDMLANGERAFRGLLAFLRVPIQDGKLRRAIRAASFDSLRKQERERGFRERPEGMEAFFATGRAGCWRERLSPAQVARIRTEFLPTLQRHYPEMLDETAMAAAGT